MRIAFSPFAPDLADLDGQVSPNMLNVVPGQNSYRPIPSPSPFTDALAADPKGLWLAKTNSGDFQAFAATASDIYELSGTSWSSLGSGFSLPNEENWAGVQFGTDFFFNNAADGLQVFDIEAGSAVSAVGGASQAAKSMDIVEDYLMLGNTATSPREVQWCDTNDAGEWADGNSGAQVFPDGGAITSLCGAAHLIIQEYVIRRVIPDPGGDIFAFEKLEQAKGSISPDSVIRFGETVAYLAEDGFWWAGEPIGQNAVNRYFLNQINQNQLYTVLGRIDPTRPLFWWHFRSSDEATYDRALIYNWRTKKWGEVAMNILFAAESATTGYTLETLSAEYPDLETVPFSLDSRVWLGGRPVYAVIDTDRKLGFLEGSNLEADLDVGERQLIAGARARVKGVRPLIDSPNAMVRTRTRDRLGDTGIWGADIDQQASGLCPINRGGRYHRFKVKVPAGSIWTHATGIEIPDDQIMPDGLR